MVNLGDRYENGVNVQADLTKAVELYQVHCLIFIDNHKLRLKKKRSQKRTGGGFFYSRALSLACSRLRQQNGHAESWILLRKWTGCGSGSITRCAIVRLQSIRGEIVRSMN